MLPRFAVILTSSDFTTEGAADLLQRAADLLLEKDPQGVITDGATEWSLSLLFGYAAVMLRSRDPAPAVVFEDNEERYPIAVWLPVIELAATYLTARGVDWR